MLQILVLFQFRLSIRNFCSETFIHFVNNKINIFEQDFVKSRYTVFNLVNLKHTLAENFDNRLQTDGMYTNFSKAFDRIDHSILLHTFKIHCKNCLRLTCKLENSTFVRRRIPRTWKYKCVDADFR